MQGLTAYSGLTTKIRAMQGKLLTDDDYRKIVELEDVPAVVMYLREKPAYARFLSQLDESELHRGDVELVLRKSVFYDFGRLYSFASQRQREFLRFYAMRFEVYFLKQCLAHVFDDRKIPLDLTAYEDFLRKYSVLDFEQLTTAETLSEIMEDLKDTIYYTPLSHLKNISKPTLFDYETALDLFNFGQFWANREKIVMKQDLKLLTEILGAKFDMLNIQWISRAKQYYSVNPADIYALLIPVNYKVKKSELRAMVEAETTEDLNRIIDQSYYSRRFRARDLEEPSLEKRYTDILKHILVTESRQYPYSVATIYSYLYHKEHEIDRLIIALECVRYQIAPDMAMQHIAYR